MTVGAHCTASMFRASLVAALLPCATRVHALSMLQGAAVPPQPGGGTAASLAAAGHGGEDVDCLVVVRTHRPMPGMLERFREHTEDLRRHLPSARLVISVDTSGPDGPAVLEEVRRHAPGAILHSYGWGDVVARYPALAALEFASAWSFHTEPLLLAVEHAGRVLGLAGGARVWALEDDVFFCGGLSAFVSAYEADPSDLLGIGDTPTGHWLHRQAGSAAFLRRYPAEVRLAGPEVVQRFSARLLEQLGRQAEEGVTAWSEMFAATACRAGGFLCAGLRDEHVGVHGDKVTLDRQQAEAACRERLGVPSANHAAKF